ncbi:MAG: hypothetical protein JJE17_06145 [Peptostreptococcaceae bacterium]|nr:hypothetical protein [Peptostreptococcaceae bacterium]
MHFGKELVYFLKTFGDKCHHGKEENYFFKELENQGIPNEGDILFVKADKILDEAKQDEIFEKFEQHEENIIGHGVHEELHAMIHKWAEEFEVH